MSPPFRAFLGLLLAVAVVAALAQALPWSRFYENELCPWLPPNETVRHRELVAAVRTPLVMADTLLTGRRDASRLKLVALTFDDGPYPLYTPLLLDLLEHYHVHATFFVIGQHVNDYPDLARQIAAGGHELANHSYRHLREGQLKPGELSEELRKTEDAVARTTGQHINLFRPPGGSLTTEGIATVQGLGYTMVNGTVNPGDWWLDDPEALLRNAYRGRNREGVVLLHSGRLGIIRALPSYINSLRAKGFRFVTVSELAAAVGPPLPPCPRK